MHTLPQIELVDEVGSTNDEALALGRSGAGPGAAVAARRQTSGRGRRGHVWESPEGNLYLSIVLRPQVAPARLPGLAAACGLGSTRGLARLGLGAEVRLKWPNDLLARGRKLAGILVEAARDDAGSPFAVCGIGVNVGRAPRGLGATCLAELTGDGDGTGPGLDLAGLAEALRAGIVGRCDAWAASGGARPLDGLLEDYEARLAWRGEPVVALSPEGAELARGTLSGVDAWGRAVLACPDGPRFFSAERASLRPAR